MLQRVKKKNLYQEIAGQLMKLITNGHFKPGQQMPGERELAARLGVNRTSLREALRVLEMMRIVEKRVGEGVYVRDISRESSLEALVFRFLAEDGLDRDSLRGAGEAIVIVESNIARLAAERAANGDLARLDELLDQMNAGIDDIKTFTALDYDFHMLIGQLAQSPVLFSVVSTMWIIMKRYAAALHCATERRLKCLEGHRRIAAAIMAADGDTACREMECHLNGAVVALITETYERRHAPAWNIPQNNDKE